MPLAESMVLEPLLLDLSTLHLTDEQFYQVCLANPEQRLELTSTGVLIIMSPMGGESGSYELELGTDLTIWNRRTELGKVFSSSTVFRLPLGGQRSPDAAWVERSRWEALTPEQRRKFPPIAPDFLIELRSATDSLDKLEAKMVEYRENGVRLGLLINPQDQQAEIYRLGQDVEVLQSPVTVSGEEVLPGFVLDLTRIWSS
jgi:Uma2 family endonuclease